MPDPQGVYQPHKDAQIDKKPKVNANLTPSSPTQYSLYEAGTRETTLALQI
jgi:hypothetical protein